MHMEGTENYEMIKLSRVEDPIDISAVASPPAAPTSIAALNRIMYPPIDVKRIMIEGNACFKIDNSVTTRTYCEILW